MSSTNRSDARDKHIADYYVTPIRSITDFLMEFFDDNPSLDFNDKSILDPCAGGDKDNPMSYPEAIKKWSFKIPPRITTIDVREDSRAEVKKDYFLADFRDKFDIVITNPPFGIALEVIQRALVRNVHPGGLVIMLLRLNFFGSKLRSEWFAKQMPTWCYVHSRRMRFTNTSGTDSIEYMHAVWIKDNYPKFTKLRII